jgi:hypothetical protein
MAASAFDSLAVRIQSEYREMPGLRLTRAQAQRLWGLEATTCGAVLEYLIEARFLCRTSAGEYARLTDGPSVSPPLRMAQVQSLRKLPARDVA